MDTQPTIFKKQSGDDVEFYLIGKNLVVKLKSISLIGAFQEALLIEPNLNKKDWVDTNNQTVPVLFKI